MVMVLNRKRVKSPFQVGGELLTQVEQFDYLKVLLTSVGEWERINDRQIGATSVEMHNIT